MKVFVTGTRGIPDIPGGVEKHCQELYPIIAAKGHQILLSTRKPYVTSYKSTWQKVYLVHTYAPHRKSIEAIVHTFLSVIKARLFNPDIVHIHAIGPGLMVPFARLLGLKVVVTNHGPDYDRQKWGIAAKTMLRLGEYLGSYFANEVIVISKIIEGIVQKRCDRNVHLIYNGVVLPRKSEKNDFLNKIGVAKKEYIIAVSRFVPEKGLDLLIQAFQSTGTDYKLVIAGDSDHETQYSKSIRELAAQDNRIILTGYIGGEELNQVYSHARLFVLPSFHEGLPIALLEAMSYGLSVLVSDIPANLEVGLSQDRYFKCGDVGDLQQKMKILVEKQLTEVEKQKIQRQIKTDYNWNTIAEQTIEVYKKVMAG
ncbi:MAG: glycosyl transferase family 1 [Desulfobacterium sp.]|nr:glycosyl transferase family 1 [Desulfobacterium sp.]